MGTPGVPLKAKALSEGEILRDPGPSD